MLKKGKGKKSVVLWWGINMWWLDSTLGLVHSYNRDIAMQLRRMVHFDAAAARLGDRSNNSMLNFWIL
jgi:hypothetical protein